MLGTKKVPVPHRVPLRECYARNHSRMNIIIFPKTRQERLFTDIVESFDCLNRGLNE